MSNAGQVIQSGSVTAGHPLIWTTDGVAQDGGSVSAPSLTLLALVNSGTFFAVNNAAATGAYASWQKTYTATALVEDLEVHSGQATISIVRINNGNTISTWNPNTFQINSGYIVSGRTVTANTTLTATDFVLGVNTASTGITVTLLQSPENWRRFEVFDQSGNANTHNIIVSSGNGSMNINGATLATISASYGAAAYTFNPGTGNWMGK